MPSMSEADHPIELIAWYELPAALAVTAGCFGKTVKVEVAGRKGRMLLPQLDWSGEDPQVTAPAVAAETLRHIDHYKRSAEDRQLRGYWGSVSSWHPKKRQLSKVHANAVVIVFSAQSSEIAYSDYLYGRGHPQAVFITNMFGLIDDWFDRFRSWLEVRVDQDLDFSHPLPDIEMPGGGLQLLTVDNGLLSLPASASNMIFHTSSDESATLPIVRKAAAQANYGASPEDAHILLRDGRRAARRQQYRRAVIDVGSALELALADFNNRVAQVNVGNRPTLGTYVRNQHISSVATLPSNIYQDVVLLRNEAIHHNRVPSRQETANAIALVAAVINRLHPLPI